MINGKKGFPVSELPSFVANIKIPVDADRATYVNYCYRTGTVFLMGVDNQFETNVLVSRELLNRLRFPNDSSELGSTVLCITDRVYGTSKVVGLFQDSESEQEIFEENQWRVYKVNGESFVDIDAKANSGEFNLTAHSGGNDNVASNFRFLNTQGTAKLAVEVQGDFNIDVDNELNVLIQRKFHFEIEDIDNNEGAVTKITYEAGTGFTYLDEFENSFEANEDGFLMKNSNGEEFSLNGNGFSYKNSKADLKSIITDFLDSMIQSIIQTPSGPGAFDAGTLAKLNTAKADVNNLFS